MQREMKIGKISEDTYTQQAVEILAALRKLGEKVRDDSFIEAECTEVGSDTVLELREVPEVVRLVQTTSTNTRQDRHRQWPPYKKNVFESSVWARCYHRARSCLLLTQGDYVK